MVHPKRWNTMRIAMTGALVGLIYIIAKHVIAPTVPDAPSFLGEMIGGAIGGAAIFAIVAGTRNWAVGAR